MAAARRARELGKALLNVGGNANEARRLINRGARFGVFSSSAGNSRGGAGPSSNVSH
jgi:hypothetical protein